TLRCKGRKIAVDHQLPVGQFLDLLGAHGRMDLSAANVSEDKVQKKPFTTHAMPSIFKTETVNDL
ncbi:hypothetical protein, partial [Tritonibacter sp. SIMBA_163]|uniref:hypothetical protein n=1 Tax=Tritonibacter sp. SIMBA_163 TaxID=3080868 RepID=UPI003980DFCC